MSQFLYHSHSHSHSHNLQYSMNCDCIVGHATWHHQIGIGQNKKPRIIAAAIKVIRENQRLRRRRHVYVVEVPRNLASGRIRPYRLPPCVQLRLIRRHHRCHLDIDSGRGAGRELAAPSKSMLLQEQLRKLIAKEARKQTIGFVAGVDSSRIVSPFPFSSSAHRVRE